MDALAKVLRHFIVRDAVYMTGGGLVIASFLYAFDRPSLDTVTKVPVVFYFLIAALAHAIGYAISDTAS